MTIKTILFYSILSIECTVMSVLDAQLFVHGRFMLLCDMLALYVFMSFFFLHYMLVLCI